MNEEENVGTSEVTTQETTGTADVTEGTMTNDTKKSLNKLLAEDKELQSQFDSQIKRSIDNAVSKAKKVWEEDIKKQKDEADKLAKMNEDEKTSYKMQELENENRALKQKLTARDLQAETIKQAGEKGIPISLIDTFDFEKETAESINKKLEIFAKTLDDSKAKVREEYSKEPAPRTGDRDKTQAQSGFDKFLEKYKK